LGALPVLSLAKPDGTEIDFGVFVLKTTDHRMHPVTEDFVTACSAIN